MSYKSNRKWFIADSRCLWISGKKHGQTRQEGPPCNETIILEK